jgi:hypothetical protein
VQLALGETRYNSSESKNSERESKVDSRCVAKTLLKTLAARCGLKFVFSNLAILAGIASGTLAAAQPRVVVVLPASPTNLEQLAAEELTSHLRVLYPAASFQTGTPSPSDWAIYLGTAQDLPAKFAGPVESKLANPESFAVTALNGAESHSEVIAGGSPRAVLFAVDALLEKLGFGAYLSYNTVPPAGPAPFSFTGWELEDTPIVGERVIFDWHNFLSGCSTWNLEEWQQWITQAERMRFNTVMVHAYGNNPMFSFSMNGQSKPTGYLANTEFGRDWGTQHVLDVRKMVGASGFFNGPVFGADASLVGDADRESAAQGLMQRVFKFAADRGMGVTFALDVDTEPANPQNVIRTLPASARFEVNRLAMADPDSAEGYAYYRNEIERLMKLYPEITQLAVWFRGGLNSPWRELQPADFPAAWRGDFQKALDMNPRLKNDPEAPSLFAISKIVRAFRKALDETGHSSVTMAAGSWRFTYVPSADAFLPAGVGLMPLDYDYAFASDPVQESLRAIGRHRPVVPIVWAQHDDREYAGRSYTPIAGLGSMLRWSNSAGYGVIHWTTRPLDLFFKNVSQQVWQASENETLDVTAGAMAKGTFGPKAEELGKRYLLNWIYDGPAFGEETTDRFVNRIHVLDASNEEAGARMRLDLLSKMRPLTGDKAAQERIDYFADWEHYATDVYEAQSALQKSYAAFEAGDIAQARREIAAADPEAAIEAYARAIRHGQTSQGEKGILVTLNLRWLPYFEAQRQAVGLDALQVEFAPTTHEPLAQGAGHFTFDFDAAHKVIEVLGTSELGVEVHTFAPGTKCASGVEVSAPVQLAAGGLAGAKLPDGNYRVKLAMADADKVNFESGGASQQLTSASGAEARASDGKVNFTLSPVAGAVRVCGLSLTMAHALSQ